MHIRELTPLQQGFGSWSHQSSHTHHHQEPSFQGYGNQIGTEESEEGVFATEY
jgi:hypothetical protein